MDRVVVDTDVVSFLFKRDTRAELYRAHLDDKELIISFQTLAELFWWTLVRNWGAARKKKLEQHLRQFAIHPYDAALCLTWAAVSFSAHKSGRPINAADAWIAATAVQHGLPLVTHNQAHYGGVAGLVLISES